MDTGITMDFDSKRPHDPNSEPVEEPTSPVHPVAPYPPVLAFSNDTKTIRQVKRAAGGRAPEFYGFVAWLVTLLVYLTYILWALLPDKVIQGVGIEWYPAREWAILLPAWSVVLFLTAYFVYIALGIYKTPALSSLTTLTDSRARYPQRSEQEQGPPNSSAISSSPYLEFAAPNAIHAPYDLPPALVNRVLYGTRPRSERRTWAGGD
ncbi:PIG-P-domain-containing protein [Serendipita vermifera]|nr:PIG-P-domain-containing protein [Serendipita vermifera]